MQWFLGQHNFKWTLRRREVGEGVWPKRPVDVKQGEVNMSTAPYVLGFVNRNLKFFPFFEKDRLPIRLDRLAKFNEIFEIFG